MDLAPGTYVTPEVRLLRPLGEGGMGTVWLAEHERLGCEVAVKLLSDLALDDRAARERFAREAALSAKIDDPHAVKTFDHGVMDDGRPYLVMERLHGEPLGDRLAREGRLRPPEVGVIVRQVARVLDQAHRLGVVHRDIKPDNLFLLDVDAGLFTKVLDFGIAKHFPALDVSRVTDTGAIVGTPEYMSPEQLLSTHAADARADRWALAVLAYHALTGRLPFHGETLPALSIAICGGACEPPSSYGLPASLDAWFARAFAPEPEERFDSVLEMATLLQAEVGGVAELVAEADDLEEPPPESGRRRSVAPADDLMEALADELSFSEDEEDEVLAPNAVLTPEQRREELAALTDAPPERDSGVRDAYPDADADQSGRRRALAEHLAGEVVSPTFAGSTSEVPRREPASRTLTAMVALLLVIGAAIAVVGYQLRETPVAPATGGETVEAPAEPSPEPIASVAPTASALANEGGGGAGGGGGAAP